MHLSGSSSRNAAHVLRLKPDEKVMEKLLAYVDEHKIAAGVLMTAVGSLTSASIRWANQPNATLVEGHFEVVSLVGMVSNKGGYHVHICIADAQGKAFGGHLFEGTVYTTLEIGLLETKDLVFDRQLEPKYGYNELVMSKL